MTRTAFAVLAAMLLTAPLAVSADRSGQDVYENLCVACHGTGVAGAPRMGDKKRWAHPLSEGRDHLIAHALKGGKIMPPKGGVAGLSDLEVARAVVHMTLAAGGSFPEPTAEEVAAIRAHAELRHKHKHR